MRLLKRLHALLFRRRFDSELEEELRFHIEQSADEHGDANEARRRFGNPTAVRESTRDLFTFQRIEALWLDVRHGTRSLRRNPIMLIVAVLSLALGIGATSTIYSLVDTLLIHDVTARDPGRLARFNALSYPNYQEVRDSGVFEELAAYNIGSLRWRDGDQTREAIAHFLSPNFFEVVGVHAALGRVFASSEAAPEKNPRIVVISHRFWQSRFEGDPNVIGRVLTFYETPFTVIGVLPAEYRSMQGIGVHPDVFVPFNTALNPNLFDRRAAVMLPLGRLPAGKTREQTRQALMAEMHRLEQRFRNQLDRPQVLEPASGLARYRQVPEAQPILTFSLLLGIVAVLVLLIACANVAGLLLARGVARRREIAVRLAVGASRIQLVRQLLVEAALVATAGTAGGIGFTFWAASLLTNVVVPGAPVRFDFSPDWRFACAAAALGGIATLLSGVMPALASSRPDLTHSLRTGRNAITPRLRLRSLLVTAQIAVSVILLSGAFLFVRNLAHVLQFDPGFDVAHTLWLDMLTDRRMPRQDQVELRDKVYRELVSQPGVESVSWAWYLPFNIEYAAPLLRRAEGSGDFRVTEQGIGPDYLKTMRIPLLSGREFNRDDLNPRDRNLPQAVIINQAFARAYFQDRSPIGERLLRVDRNGGGEPLVIIGVSGNTSFRSLGEEPVPLLQSLSTINPSFVVRVAGSSSAARKDLAKVIERNAPGVDVGYFTTLERLHRGTWSARATTLLLSILATVGLTLALIGLCGVSIYNVTRRTPEIGIRMALGATAQNVMRLMLRDGLTLVLAGAAIGIVSALALTRLLSGFLAAGISPWDAPAFIAMLLTLLATAGVSVWLPSRRATRIDPTISLRVE